MKSIMVLFFPVLIASFVVVDLKPVDGDDSVTFTIKNFGIKTKGELKGLSGTIKWDAANPAISYFNVNVDVNTINTGIEMRDNDLKKKTYFNTEKYPTINFTSTAITADNVTGNLTIKGVTKQISFPFTATASGSGYVFEGNFTINRQDFNVGGGSAVLSNTVNVSLKVHANP